MPDLTIPPSPTTVSPAAVALVKRFEGLQLAAYPDPGTGDSPWTIGYGHTGPEVTVGVTITEELAEALLRDDLDRAAAAVLELVTVPLAQHQLDALASFAFNVGLSNLAGSMLLRYLNAGDYDAVPYQLRRWVLANGRTLPDPVARRDAEAMMWFGLEP
jgi:lysozyme